MTTNASKTVVGACPLDCPDACSWVVTLEDGVPVKLRGNADHPHTRKGLCVKVNPYLAYTRHPERLLTPLRRVGAKGDGAFEPIGWDEALDEIATRLADVIAKHGGEAIWPYRGTGTMGYLQGIGGAGSRLFHSLGASRHDPNICSAAAYPGLEYTSGRGSSMDPLDIVDAGLIIVWGANTVSTNQHLWPFMMDARRNGAEVVVIDPVRTRTAQRADHHLPIRPGTDGALAMGLMSELVRLDHVHDRVAEAVGWDEFRSAELDAWNAERAASLCDVGADQIRQLAEMMATRGPVAIRLGMGMQRHAAGGQAARLVSCLPLFTGDYGRLGGGLCYSTGPLYAVNTDALNRPDLQPEVTRELAMTRLGHGLLELDDPPVHALVIIAANPVVSNPEQHRVRAGLARDDLFCVVIDNFQTDTADYADIVLPSTMQTEHVDFHDSVSHLFLNFNSPVAEPPGECLSHTEIFRRLAARIGLDEPALFASDDELLVDALTTDHRALAEVDLGELRRTGFVRLDYPVPFLPFATSFETPSGRFEFASEVAAAAGHGRLPHYVAPREAADEDDMFSLIAAGNHYLMNSMFANSSDHVKAGGVEINLHSGDAAKLGLSQGSRVRVHNDRGEFFAECVISEGGRRGVASMTKGHWPKLEGGATINATTLEADADMARGAIFHDNRVWITSCLDPEEPVA